MSEAPAVYGASEGLKSIIVEREAVDEAVGGEHLETLKLKNTMTGECDVELSPHAA